MRSSANIPRFISHHTILLSLLLFIVGAAEFLSITFDHIASWSMVVWQSWLCLNQISSQSQFLLQRCSLKVWGANHAEVTILQWSVRRRNTTILTKLNICYNVVSLLKYLLTKVMDRSSVCTWVRTLQAAQRLIRSGCRVELPVLSKYEEPIQHLGSLRNSIQQKHKKAHTVWWRFYFQLYYVC